jgi:hypothetical protein
MANDLVQMEQLAGQVHAALQTADLTGYRELLDPNVTWGAPDDMNPVAGTGTKCSPGIGVAGPRAYGQTSSRRWCATTRSLWVSVSLTKHHLNPPAGRLAGRFSQ